uniref:ARAD1B03718p n=1 Tax=Blastobotrys adeninivorans TaxID=409370 RepID=A0A060T9Z6_BLAAD
MYPVRWLSRVPRARGCCAVLRRSFTNSCGLLQKNEFAQPNTTASDVEIKKRFTAKSPSKSDRSAQSLRHVPLHKRMSASPNSEAPAPATKTCTTISTCEQYNLPEVVKLFYKAGLRSASMLLPAEMVHVEYPYSAGKSADVLVLLNGTIVAWGMTEIEVIDQLIPLLKPSEIRSYKQIESEDMDYVEEVEEHSQKDDNSSSNSNGNGPISNSEPTSTMIGDVIYIRGTNESQRLLNKAAFSSGLARNTKLAALEISLEKYISVIKDISHKLATGGHLGLKGSDALKITGQLLQIRGQLNLYSELIETPDLYWSEPQLEALYALISRKLDVAPRISILNKKLDYASELVGILKTHTSEQQSTRLEWMIIVLILVEVCFEIAHFSERFFSKNTEKDSS